MSARPLVPDPQLQFSASLAATVGLEEAILIQQLRAVYLHQPAVRRDGRDWLHVSHDYLLDLLPFWDGAALTRLFDSLEALALIRLDRHNAAPRCFLLAIDEARDEPPVSPPVTARATPRLPEAASSAGPSAEVKKASPQGTGSPPRRGGGEPLPPDFQPSEDMLELLERFHGIPPRFALAQLEDFTLYWRERGSANHAWQNKFKQHVQFQWARYQQEFTRSGHGEERGSGGARRTRDSSLEHDLTDTSWAE